MRSSGTLTVPRCTSPPNPVAAPRPVSVLKTVVFPEPAKPTRPTLMGMPPKKSHYGWEGERSGTASLRCDRREIVIRTLNLRQQRFPGAGQTSDYRKSLGVERPCNVWLGRSSGQD